MNTTFLNCMFGASLTMFSISAFAQDAENVTELLSVTSDVSLRSDGDNANKANATATAIEMYTSRTEGEITKDFVGLMSFAVPDKTGYSVKSATLRLTTERAKGTLAIYAFNATVSDADTYNSQKDNIAAARATTALSTQRLNGTNNKAVTDAGASSNIEDWQNNIDITDYVKSVGSGNVSLLLANNAESTTTAIKVYSSDATDVTNSNVNFTFSAADLKPQLTVVYELDADQKTNTSNSVADTWIRSGNTSRHGSETTMELCVYTNEEDNTKNKTFLGLMSFQLPTDVAYSNYTVKSAKLRLVSERVKGARGVKLYGYETFDENTTYATEETKVTSAINDDNLVASFDAKGSAKAMVTDQLEDAYKTADAWTNIIDVTDYVNKLSDSNLSLLFVKDNSSESTKFYTHDLTEDVVNSKDNTVKFAAADLVPQLTVDYTLATYTLNVTDAGAATMVLPYEAQIPEGVKAYTLTYTSGSNAVAKEVEETIPANTPVLVNANEGKYEFKATTKCTTKEDSPVSGCLNGAWEETEVPVGSYILQNQNGTVAFYKVNTSGIKVSANQAYLKAEATGEAKLGITYGDEATDINAVDAANNDKSKSADVYTIDGKKVVNGNFAKGKIYISNGKAFILK